MSQIPTLRAHIWQTKYWQIYPLKWQFHRFLLWEFIFGRPGLGKSTPSLSRSQMTISQISNLSPHIWQTRSWKIFHLPIKQWFHRFLLWKLIFGRWGLDISTPIPHSDFTDSYFDSSFLPDQVLAYFPSPPKQWFHRFLLWEFIFGRPGLGRSTSPLEYSFYRFLLWEFIFQ